MTDPKVSEMEQLLEKMWREYVAQFKDEDAEVYKSDLVLYQAICDAIEERERLRRKMGEWIINAARILENNAPDSEYHDAMEDFIIEILDSEFDEKTPDD